MRTILPILVLCFASLSFAQARIESPQDDYSGKYAQALASYFADNEDQLESSKFLPLSFFTWKAKTMMPFVRKDKYFATHLKVSGIMIALWDSSLGETIQMEANEVVDDPTGQDTLSDAEQKAIAEKTASQFDYMVSPDAKTSWHYGVGAHTGSLAAYITMWHLTPDNPTLAEWISSALESCSKEASEAPAGTDPGMVAALRALGAKKKPVYGSRELGAVSEALGAFLKSTVSPKYRWKEAGG